MKYFFFLIIFFFFFKVNAQEEIVDSIQIFSLNKIIESPNKLLFSGQEFNRVSSIQDFSKESQLSSIFFVLLFISTLFIVLRAYNLKYSNTLFMSLKSIHLARKVSRSPNNIGLLTGYLYLFIFSILFAINFSFIADYFLNFKASINFYFFAILLFLFSEILFIEVTSFIVGKKLLAHKLRFSNLATIYGSFLLLFPITFLLRFTNGALQLFSSYLFFVLMLLIILFKEYRTIRFLILEKISVGFFHIFLYICTFKIIPFIILIKVIFLFE